MAQSAQGAKGTQSAQSVPGDKSNPGGRGAQGSQQSAEGNQSARSESPSWTQRRSTSGEAISSDPTEVLSGRAKPRTGAKGPRRARLLIRRIDPWSVLKFSFLLAIVIFVIWMVAVTILYGVLQSFGILSLLNDTIGSLLNAKGSASHAFTARNVLGAAVGIGVIEVFLFTALATLGAFIYNLCTELVGGLEVTLAERD